MLETEKAEALAHFNLTCGALQFLDHLLSEFYTVESDGPDGNNETNEDSEAGPADD